MLAFEVASTVVFILECTPIHDFWVTLGGYLAPELGGRCINLVKFLLVNGSINTVTDFALLLTVGDGSPGDRGVALMRPKALTNTLASESKHAAEVYPDRHLHLWFSVSRTTNLFL